MSCNLFILYTSIFRMNCSAHEMNFTFIYFLIQYLTLTYSMNHEMIKVRYIHHVYDVAYVYIYMMYIVYSYKYMLNMLFTLPYLVYYIILLYYYIMLSSIHT